MQKRGEFPGIATVDCCLNLVFCFGVLLQLAIVSLNPVTSPGAAHQNSLALYLIKVSWPGDCRDDVDTYVQDPQGHLVYFRALNDGAMTLEHDDTGNDAITHTGSDGVTQYVTDNQERVDIRAIAPGEYTVNVHMYRKDRPGPTTVLVTLYKVTDSADIELHTTSLVMKEQGEEQTAFRFTLRKDGDVLDYNKLQRRFVGLK